jgi:hypothetical protein
MCVASPTALSYTRIGLHCSTPEHFGVGCYEFYSIQEYKLVTLILGCYLDRAERLIAVLADCGYITVEPQSNGFGKHYEEKNYVRQALNAILQYLSYNQHQSPYINGSAATYLPTASDCTTLKSGS